MNAAGMLARLPGSATYTVTRRAVSAADTHGVMVEGAATTFSIVASITPATGRDVERVPEAYWSKEMIRIITATELKTPDDNTAGDVVPWSGRNFQVQHVAPWNAAAAWDAIAVRVA